MVVFWKALPIVAAASIQLVWAQPHDHAAGARVPEPAAEARMPREPALDSRAAREPTDAQAVVPPIRYESPFTGYRGYRDERVGSWRDANDTVGRIGGWRAYAREAAEADPAKPAGAPDAAKADAAKPAAPKPAGKSEQGGHSGHGAK